MAVTKEDFEKLGYKVWMESAFCKGDFFVFALNNTKEKNIHFIHHDQTKRTYPAEYRI